MTYAPELSQIPSEKTILRHLKKIIFNNKVKCPDCGRKNKIVCLQHNKVWRCRKCRNKFSITSINWLKGMKISVRHLWALIWCWQHKLSVQQTRSLLKLSIPTVRRYYELFRDHLNLEEYEVLLEGKVQVDEMFVKGAFVIGGKDIKRKKIKLNVVFRKSPNKQDAMNFIFNHVKPGSTFCTDGGAIYRGCEKWWPLQHKRDIHSKFEFAITSEIEAVWANLRTFIRRMYHHVTIQKLSKIVAEFEARFSHHKSFDSPLNFLKNSLCSVTLAF